MIRKPRTEKKFTPEDDSVMSNAACLNRIFKKVELEGLSREAVEELTDDVKSISEKFSICPKGAILLAAILEKNVNSGCDEEILANYIGCTNIEFLSFHDALKELDDKGIVRIQNGRRQAYTVTQEAIKAIEKNSEFVPVKMDNLSTDEIFSRFRKLIADYRNDRIDAERLVQDENRLMENNQQLLFCRKALDSDLFKTFDGTEKRMFYYLCHRYVSHSDQSVEIDILMNLTDYFEDETRIKRCLANERSDMQKSGLVVFGNDEGFVNNEKLALSDEVKRTWFDEIELAPAQKVNHKDLISASNIKGKALFYNAAEKEQVERLTDLLMEDNFKQVQARLESQAMPRGLAIMFYGVPGSGKTATVFEIARRTGRDVMMVDISATKSKWYGESEKMMKQVFDSYRNLVRTSQLAPILVMNEADAIMTRRLSNADSSTDLVNNAIADVVLNELETLDGILIATTNLVSNMMDEKENALERRFLYKIEFKTPEEEVRAAIWKSKIGDLTDEQASTLARQFCIAGGNIDNIARKSTVDFVLTGKRPELEALTQYCRDEIITKKAEKARTRIGY